MWFNDECGENDFSSKWNSNCQFLYGWMQRRRHHHPTESRSLFFIFVFLFLIRLKWMIGWYLKKKVTLIQIAHWLPVLIEEFLFPRFYSFTILLLFHSDLNAYAERYILMRFILLIIIIILPLFSLFFFHFLCSFGSFILFQVIVRFFYTRNA